MEYLHKNRYFNGKIYGRVVKKFYYFFFFRTNDEIENFELPVVELQVKFRSTSIIIGNGRR